MINKVIYTCLIGFYDDLKDPKYVIEDWDYICFSNHLKQSDFNVWKIIKIPNQFFLSNTKLSRLPKIRPDLFLKDYDYSLYIDSNITILDDFLHKILMEKINKNIFMSVPYHFERNCIYEEAKICVEIGKEKKQKADRLMKFYRKENFPENFGLFENGLIFRNHKNKNFKRLSEHWWFIYKKFSRRDQLSLMYIIWKLNLNIEPLFPVDFKLRESLHFEFKNHLINNQYIKKPSEFRKKYFQIHIKSTSIFIKLFGKILINKNFK